MFGVNALLKYALIMFLVSAMPCAHGMDDSSADSGADYTEGYKSGFDRGLFVGTICAVIAYGAAYYYRHRQYRVACARQLLQESRQLVANINKYFAELSDSPKFEYAQVQALRAYMNAALADRFRSDVARLENIAERLRDGVDPLIADQWTEDDERLLRTNLPALIRKLRYLATVMQQFKEVCAKLSPVHSVLSDEAAFNSFVDAETQKLLSQGKEGDVQDGAAAQQAPV